MNIAALVTFCWGGLILYSRFGRAFPSATLASLDSGDALVLLG